MDLQLTGKVAWVTGGSGGIGSAIARALVAEGCVVAITGRDEAHLEEVARELSVEGRPPVLAVPADTSRTEQVDAAAAKIVEQLGSLDILVNCAGVPGGRANGPLDTVDDQQLLEDLNTKYVGYLRCARAAARPMREHGWGRIIHVSGTSSRESGTYSTGGRNIAIIHMSKSISDELGQFGITSNVVHPAITRTNALDQRFERQAKAEGTTPEEIDRRLSQANAIRRIIDADEVAHVVAFLASPLAVGVTGESLAAGGGPHRGVTL